MDKEKYTVRGENGEFLALLRRGGIEYVTSTGISYYIDSEMVSSDECDFVIYSSYIKLYQDYKKEKSLDNIEYFEKFDDKTGLGKGYIRYKKRFDSHISRKEKDYILKRVKQMCTKAGIKICIVQRNRKCVLNERVCDTWDMGNLFESREKDDRKYDAGGRLAEDDGTWYRY